MATTSSRLISLARTQLGVGENPPGSNYTKYGKWYGLDGTAWCAMFVSWCANQVDALDIIPKHAYTPTGAKWFYDRGQWGTTPRVGALVYFAFYGSSYGGRWKGIHHVGIVESIRADGRVVCIEGNVSNKVTRVVRSRSGIAGYGYPKYTSAVTPPPPPPQEDTMDYRFVAGWAEDEAARKRVEAVIDQNGLAKVVDGPAFGFHATTSDTRIKRVEAFIAADPKLHRFHGVITTKDSYTLLGVAKTPWVGPFFVVKTVDSFKAAYDALAQKVKSLAASI